MVIVDSWGWCKHQWWTVLRRLGLILEIQSKHRHEMIVLWQREREKPRSVTRYVQTRTITITQLIKHHRIWDGDGVEPSTRHNMYHDEQLAFRVGCLMCVCSFLTQAWSMYTTSCRCIVSPSYISMLPGLTRKTSMCPFNKWDFPNDMTGTNPLSCRV